MFAGVAVMGYMMFGASTESQFTLNMPHELVASNIAVWTTVRTFFPHLELIIRFVIDLMKTLLPSLFSLLSPVLQVVNPITKYPF